MQRAAAAEAVGLGEGAAAAAPLAASQLPRLSAIVDEALRLEPGRVTRLELPPALLLLLSSSSLPSLLLEPRLSSPSLYGRILHFRLRARRATRLPLGAGRRVWVPAGTLLVVSPYLLHRHPRHWPQPPRGAEPVAQPDLFLRQREGTEGRRAPAASAEPQAGGGEGRAAAYMPFGAGPKRCVASGFALAEARLLLAAVLRRFELRALPRLSVYADARLQLRARGADEPLGDADG